MKALDKTLAFLADLFSDEEGPEPGFDPVHLGGSVVITITAIGGLYWLLWTLLVYEGGIGTKITAVLKLLFTRTTLAQLGYEGWPYAPGPFEGGIGNGCALILTVVVGWVLRRLYQRTWKPTQN